MDGWKGAGGPACPELQWLLGEGWGMLRAPHAHPLPTGTGAWLVPRIPSATRGRWQATLDGVVSLCWHLYVWGHWRENVLSMQMGKRET